MEPEKPELFTLAALKESPRMRLWHLACQRGLRPQPEKPDLAREQICIFHSHGNSFPRYLSQSAEFSVLVGEDWVRGGGKVQDRYRKL